MELKELLREIHWIEWQLRKFEDRYGVRSEDFFKAMEAGELADFDDIDDPHFHDFMEWHGLCKAWHWRSRQVPPAPTASSTRSSVGSSG